MLEEVAGHAEADPRVVHRMLHIQEAQRVQQDEAESDQEGQRVAAAGEHGAEDRR